MRVLGTRLSNFTSDLSSIVSSPYIIEPNPSHSASMPAAVGRQKDATNEGDKPRYQRRRQAGGGKVQKRAPPKPTRSGKVAGSTSKKKRAKTKAQPTPAFDTPTSSSHVDSPDEDTWWECGHKWLGLQCLRYFGTDHAVGTVVAWLPARLSTAVGADDDVALWRLRHEDGDEEDLEEHEVRAGVADLLEHQERLAKPRRTAEQNWAAFSSLRQQVWEDGGEPPQYKKGDRVLCFDRHTQAGSGVIISNVYEAVVLRVRAPAAAGAAGQDTDSPCTGEYLLHFLGFSKSQDRWEHPAQFVPLTREAQALKELMHSQWDNRPARSRGAKATATIRYGRLLVDTLPEALAGAVVPPGQLTLHSAGPSAGQTVRVASHAQAELLRFGCTTLRSSQGLNETEVLECAEAIETWFNHVATKLNTLGLQAVLENPGFSEFKMRGPGRFDVNPPALQSDDTFAFFRSPQAPWVTECRGLLGADMRCIAMGCMLSLPGSHAQPMHQDGPHLSSARHLAPYAINVFIPLVDITVENGGTEFWLATHRLNHFEDEQQSVVILAKAGQPLLFDYRIRHRGLANRSQQPRPLLYVTFARASYEDKANFSTSRYRKLPKQVMESLERHHKAVRNATSTV